MRGKIKKNKYQILELIIIFLITLLFNLICNTMLHDEVWSYGFSYNIANNLIPYKDFNMVITPLYPILGSIFMILFGKNIVIYHIFNTIISTIIFYYIKKSYPKNYYIVYSLLLPFCMPNYNLLCLLFLFILIDKDNKKTNDYLIGIILGLAFLTKQNIGIYLCIASLFTKNIKVILKRIIGFIIPNIILLIYLLYNNTLSEFIDYTILGIGSFAKENTVIHPRCLIITLIGLIYSIYKYVKTKDIKYIYLICFQGMAYPLVDPYHVVIPFIPVLGDFLNNLNLNKKMIFSTFIIFLITIFSLNIYEYTKGDYTYPNASNNFRYRKINNQVCKEMNTVVEYLKTIDGNIYIIDMYAYFLKLEMNMPINKYDLLNNGNLGKDGEIRIINEIEETCKSEKCTFLLNEKEIGNKISQYNKDILLYVINNYNNSLENNINYL